MFIYQLTTYLVRKSPYYRESLRKSGSLSWAVHGGAQRLKEISAHSGHTSEKQIHSTNAKNF